MAIRHSKAHAERAFATKTHDALHDAVGAYHERLHDITLQQEKLKLQKAILKATAMSELASMGPGLKLSSDAIARVATLNW